MNESEETYGKTIKDTNISLTGFLEGEKRQKGTKRILKKLLTIYFIDFIKV